MVSPLRRDRVEHILRRDRRRIDDPNGRRPRIPGAALLPTLCTLGNLVAGFAAVHYAAMSPDMRVFWNTWSPLTFAGALIFLGIILDAFDGALARLTRSNSDLGAQLDALADMVTCGVAPAFLVIRLVQTQLEGMTEATWLIGPEADLPYGKVIWGAAAVYVCCAALRLARFTAEEDDDDEDEPADETGPKTFQGLPSPGAAGTLASLVILHQHLLIARFAAPAPTWISLTTALVVPAVMLLCALAMVSTIRYVHFSNQYILKPESPRYIGRIVILLALAVWWFQEALAVAFTVYALSGPIGMIRRRWRKPRMPEEELQRHEEDSEQKAKDAAD